jgi:hypothetical protein
MYGGLVLLGIVIAIIGKDLDTAVSNFCIALIFDPFDVENQHPTNEQQSDNNEAILQLYTAIRTLAETNRVIISLHLDRYDHSEIGSGKPIEAFITKPIVWISLVASIIVCTIAAYYLAKWMFKVSFGKTLQQLEDNLDALRKEESTN